MIGKPNPEHDDLRRKIIANQAECKRLGEVALETPEFKAFAASKQAYEDTPQAQALFAAQAAEGEIEEECPGEPQFCELCGCPLFDDGKQVAETWTLGEDGPTGCAAAAREDEDMDCPGKRLGLI